MWGGVSVCEHYLSQRLLVVTPGQLFSFFGDGWLKLTGSLGTIRFQVQGVVLIAPLGFCQGCSPAEDLHTSQGEPSFGAHRAGQKHNSFVWYLASWNVRTLLDVEGSIRTARQQSEWRIVDERKIDQVVYELERYQVVVVALQETKWFGSDMYTVGDSVVLTSGRMVPEQEGSRQKGEGIAVVLSGSAVSAWKAGGSQWKQVVANESITEDREQTL